MNDWEARYQRGETGWDRGETSTALTHMLSRLDPGDRVLVPGCGRGHEVVALAQHGFRVTAIDIAPSAITHLGERLQNRELDAELIHGDLFDYQAAPPFDAIYEQTCLCAISPDQRKAYADKVHSWLRPGGILYAMFMQTGAEGGPPFHCDLLAMRSLFDGDRWQWPEQEPILVPHRNGRFELGYCLRQRIEVP